MRLMGRYQSPFVRRVGATLTHYGRPFELAAMPAWGEEKSQLEAVNPITRVPVLELDDGELLVDSAVILDYLDHEVGPERSLTPLSGPDRRRVMSMTAVAVGTVEKLVASLYERRFRPKEMWHRPWIEGCEKQARDGFTWLDRQFKGPFIMGDRMTQADVSTIAFWQFGEAANPRLIGGLDCPNLAALSERLKSEPAFAETMPQA